MSKRNRTLSLYCDSCRRLWPHEGIRKLGTVNEIGVQIRAHCLFCGKAGLFVTTQAILDSAGNYELGNCRGAMHKEQAQNRKARGTA